MHFSRIPCLVNQFCEISVPFSRFLSSSTKMDIATPRNVKLSGFFRRSNAVMNAQERIPNCLTAVANELNSRMPDIRLQYGQEASEEMKNIIAKIYALKDEVLQDVPFRKLLSTAPDAKFYNDYLEKMTSQDCRPTMLQTIRVYAECYVYRRVWECFELTNHLKQFDPYVYLKNEILTDSFVLLKKMAKFFVSLQENPSEDKYFDFDKLLRINLWSNKRDKPLKQEYVRDRLRNIRDIDADNAHILCNNSKAAWVLFQTNVSVMESNLIVDFILDSSGYELFQDFCLADFLTMNTPIEKIRFHVKSIPWFIWSTTENDIDYLFNKMKQMTKIYLQSLVSRWINYIRQEKWQIVVRNFWCLPNDFSEMKNIDPWLYKTLSESTLIIVKGDINYQKSVGDYNWNPETPFSRALENFHPSNIMFVRILKSDLVCGLDEVAAKRVELLHRHISKGYMGMIQYARKPPDPQGFLDWNNFKKFDPYESLKQTLFRIADPLIHKTAQYLKNIYKHPSQEDKDDFEKLIKLLLWSNQSDYIMSKEYVIKSMAQILSTKQKEGFIVCNQLEEAWNIISDRSHPSNTIAIICDNAGFELFLDLCAADYLFTNYYARTIHFHVKHIPWFISDITEKDVYWMLHQLSKSPDKILQDLAGNWKEHFKTGRWKIIVRKYWILPIGFSRMKEIDPVLYKMLEETKIVIVKGDLNYRKLLEDTNIDPSTPFREALREFYPSDMILVRVMKCDVACNIPRQYVQKFEKLNEHWMDCGQYGLIQFAPKPEEYCDCLKN
ncbi:damage-control phosphatase ARMT1-like [Coccinella septempunctata]|uniref:damage-control phosphatase ARMT1-like n=1 Tax=Coccinella septempunctata TaxID=41139 RepID=UPI001D0834BA|nr:damage-control phosphatase ARMT1-like [Coccinella septempunctata]